MSFTLVDEASIIGPADFYYYYKPLEDVLLGSGVYLYCCIGFMFAIGGITLLLDIFVLNSNII